MSEGVVIWRGDCDLFTFCAVCCQFTHSTQISGNKIVRAFSPYNSPAIHLGLFLSLDQLYDALRYSTSLSLSDLAQTLVEKKNQNIVALFIYLTCNDVYYFI